VRASDRNDLGQYSPLANWLAGNVVVDQHLDWFTDQVW